MKSKEEIEALALELYPKPMKLNSLAFDIQNSAVREKERRAFIKGYEMAQQKWISVKECKEECKHCQAEDDIDNEPIFSEKEVSVVLGKIVDHLRDSSIMDVYNAKQNRWETSDMVRGFMKWFITT